eukprot:3270108-Prymnesium_polylepis.1
MKFVDVPCGCGGLARGLTQADWECVLAVDHDDDAIKVFASNVGGRNVLKHDMALPLPNVRRLRAALRRGALVGGPPHLSSVRSLQQG